MDIRGFRGWRFAAGLDGDVSSLIAPPYDVLDAADKQRLLDKSRDNIVAVDLPHVPPKELGSEAEYDRAAARLADWQRSGVLAQDARPAVYVYEQAYEWGGRTYVRRAMLAGVRATELGEDVIPHEHVFPGPLADRLRLTEKTRTQLSPIFGFYEDPGHAVTDILAEQAQRRPAARAAIGDVVERLWVVDDPARIEAIRSALADTPVFIADGHHRYTTARNYAAGLGGADGLDADHEANFVMFALVARDDPGLVILPTHRLVSGLKESGSVEQLAEGSPEFTWRRCGNAAEVGPAGIEALLGCAGRGAMAVISGRSTALWVVELARPEAMAHAAPDQTDAWRELPPAILHKLIIDKALQPWVDREMKVEYTPRMREVIRACRSGQAQLGVILRSIQVDSVEAIARSGHSMPHKSTYFYPKISTGMVLKPLAAS